MGLIGIFFNEEGNEKKPSPVIEKAPVEEKMPTTFPSTPVQTFPEPGFSSGDSPVYNPAQAVNPFVDEVLAVYQKGFEGLNLPGVDFLEFYKAVSNDIHNGSAYKMALQIMQGIDPNFSKEKALTDSQHYVTNINKAYDDFKKGGEGKRGSLSQSKASEASTLNGEISSLENQIKALGEQLAGKKMQLGAIDTKYDGQLREVEARLSANEQAKNILLEKIQTVISNIKTNL